jgi:Nucleotidyltransferase domain
MMNSDLPTELLRQLVAELDDEHTTAIGLNGSYARGEANEYSDVDIVCYRDDMREGEAVRHWFEYRGGYLLSIHHTAIATDRAGMRNPEQAVWWVPGLRNYQVLLDKRGELTALMQEARDFRWETMQPAADEYASAQLWELSEQALKLLGGLARHDARMLYNSTTNLIESYTRIVAVQRGIMIKTQNSRIQQIEENVGLGSAWTHCYRLAMGIDEATTTLPPLEARAVAALQLHLETIALLRPILRSEHLPVIEATEAKIRAAIKTADAISASAAEQGALGGT